MPNYDSLGSQRVNVEGQKPTYTLWMTLQQAQNEIASGQLAMFGFFGSATKTVRIQKALFGMANTSGYYQATFRLLYCMSGLQGGNTKSFSGLALIHDPSDPNPTISGFGYISGSNSITLNKVISMEWVTALIDNGPNLANAVTPYAGQSGNIPTYAPLAQFDYTTPGTKQIVLRNQNQGILWYLNNANGVPPNGLTDAFGKVTWTEESNLT